MQEATPQQLEDTEGTSRSKTTDTETNTPRIGVRRRISDEQQLQIVRMYAEAAASVADIRRQFGVSEPSVYRVLDKHGVSLRGRQARGSSARTALDSGENRIRSTARTSRNGQGTAGLKQRMSRTDSDRPISTRGAMRFRIDFRVEQVVDASDIRGALRRANALGAADITEIIRVV